MDLQLRKIIELGGMLATAGGLVFNGGSAGPKFHAFDAATGRPVWEFPLSSGVRCPPTSFSVDGMQYEAVRGGLGGQTQAERSTL